MNAVWCHLAPAEPVARECHATSSESKPVPWRSVKRHRLRGLTVLAVHLLAACAARDAFETDAEQCRGLATAKAQSATEDYRLPEAVDQTTEYRVSPPPPTAPSAYALCMRSRGWKLDENGKAVGQKGLPAEEYSKLLAQDLTICARGSGEAPTPPPTGAAGSSAARVVCTCLEGEAAPGITSVDLGLVIGEGGKLRRVTAEPDSPVAACLRESLPEAEVVPPPSTPWKAKVRILHYQ